MSVDRVTEGWHLDKRVNIGHILVTLALAGSFFVWGSTLESRIAISETEIRSMKEHALRSEQRILDRMTRIESKLDRLIERE